MIQRFCLDGVTMRSARPNKKRILDEFLENRLASIGGQPRGFCMKFSEPKCQNALSAVASVGKQWQRVERCRYNRPSALILEGFDSRRRAN